MAMRACCTCRSIWLRVLCNPTSNWLRSNCARMLSACAERLRMTAREAQADGRFGIGGSQRSGRANRPLRRWTSAVLPCSPELGIQAEDGDGGHLIVPRVLDGDVLVGQVVGGLAQFRPVGLGGVERFGERGQVGLARLGQEVGDDDGGGVQRRIALLADQLLESGFLLLEVGLRHDQVALAGGHLGFGGDHVQARHGADLLLLARLLEQFLGAASDSCATRTFSWKAARSQ